MSRFNPTSLRRTDRDVTTIELRETLPIVHASGRPSGCSTLPTDNPKDQPMTLWQWGLIALATLALLGAACFATLALIKRKARGLARHAPDCIILCRRLVDDPRVPARHKLLLRALGGYLALPLDAIPDFIPIIGRLDDALIVALAIRTALRSADAELIRQHWPGPQPAPKSILRRAKGRARPVAASASAPV